MKRIVAFAAGALLASTAVATEQAKVEPSTTKCQKKGGKGTASRFVELKATDAGGCRVYLTRDDGKPTEVGHADHRLSVCTDVRDKIIASVKGSGFTCE